MVQAQVPPPNRALKRPTLLAAQPGVGLAGLILVAVTFAVLARRRSEVCRSTSGDGHMSGAEQHRGLGGAVHAGATASTIRSRTVWRGRASMCKSPAVPSTAIAADPSVAAVRSHERHDACAELDNSDDGEEGTEEQVRSAPAAPASSHQRRDLATTSNAADRGSLPPGRNAILWLAARQHPGGASNPIVDYQLGALGTVPQTRATR